jgi:hypothetical protein
MKTRTFWQSWIRKTAAALYRGENRPSRARDNASKLGFALVFGAAFTVLVLAVTNERALWSRLYPEFTVARGEWQVRVLDHALACEPSGCPVAVNDSFWGSAVSLEDPVAKSALRDGRAGEVWLGVRVPADRLAAILARGANNFILGWLKGDYSLWVNGDLLLRISDEEYSPQVFSLPDSVLRRSPELGVVIRLAPRAGAKNLVPFTAGLKEGFGDYRSGQAFRSYLRLTGSAKPFALFLVYFVLSMIFFLLWIASPKNREYLHLSLFSLICSLPNILYSDGFSFHLWPDFGMRLYVTLVFAKAATALNLGLSFSRASPRAVSRASVSILACGICAVAFASTPFLSSIRMPLNQLLISAAYLAGGLVCLLQATALLLREKEGFSFRFRQRKLLQFGGILAVLSVCQFLQYGGIFSSVEVSIFWDVPEVVLALFLGFIALSDYRTQYEMVEKTPVSPYHKRATLPESVAGVLVMLDLKNSERIFRSSLGESDPFQMPSIISAIWVAIAEFGGVVIKAEGDEVIAFFDQEQSENPLANALRAADACQVRLEELSRQGTRYVPALEYRAGISYGQIRPIWVGEGRERLPSWTQTAGSMVFVECARLMEAEKELVKEKSLAGSLTVFPNELLQRFSLGDAGLKGQLVLRAERVVGKHDRIYSVTAYRPASVLSQERVAV